MFTLEQLESFIAVAEELHFGRAAARLQMTQPPLSRRIMLLEDGLGVRLLDRSSRTVRLTAAGRVFLGDARRVVNLSREAALSVRRTLRGVSGVVTLGFTAAAAYSLLGQVLAAVDADLPDVELVLREMVTSAQLDALLDGGVDLGMVRPPVTGSDLVSAPLTREPLLAALPESHPLAERAADPAVPDFDGEPFIMYAPSEARYFYEAVVGIFRLAGVSPRYTQYLTQVHSILALVRAGRGVALVPEAAVALHYRGVVLRPVTGIESGVVRLDLAWRSSNDNPALRPLVATVRTVLTNVVTP